MTSRRASIVLIVVAAVALGALREFLFLNLNYQLDHVARHTSISYAHSLFQGWVRGWDLRQLTVLKWVLTACFIALVWGLCLLLARRLSPRSSLRRLLTLTFIGVAALALALHVAARSVPALESVSVKLLHALQYPAPLLFTWAASWLIPPFPRPDDER